MNFLSNAFSLNMLPLEKLEVTITECKSTDIPSDSLSIVGHQDTATILSGILGREVPFNRVSFKASSGINLYVAQYDGPRLPEGTTTLPSGASFRWFKVEFWKQ